MTTRTVSIGHGTSHSESVNISSVSGSNPYVATLAASVPAGVVVGDALWDEHAVPRKYLITGIGSSTLTVMDATGVGSGPDSSGSSTAYVKRYYNGSTPAADWIAALDNTGLYASGDYAVGQAYADANFVESSWLEINKGGTVGLASITLEAASGQSPKFVRTSGILEWLALDAAVTTMTLRGIEFDGGGYGNGRLVAAYSGPSTITVERCYLHGTDNNSNAYGIICNGGGTTAINVHNNIVADIGADVHNNNNAIGIYAVGGSSATVNVNNNTVYGIFRTDGRSSSVGAGIQGLSIDEVPKNNLVLYTHYNEFATEGLLKDLYLPTGGGDYNLSSDATATGTHSIANATIADQLTDPDNGDFTLKSGSDAFEAGTDLGTTFPGVNIDFTGRDRDAEGDIWSIGAYQLEAGGGSSVAPSRRRRSTQGAGTL